jgi:hypothetical protein
MLDDLVARRMEEPLLQPKRLETILASLLDRREERAVRRREHLTDSTGESARPTSGLVVPKPWRRGSQHGIEVSQFCAEMAHPTRFERVTFAFGGQRSIQLSYGCVGLI